MQFPKDRLKLSETYQGKESQTGYLVLNLRGLDLEGICELWVDLSYMEDLRKRKAEQDDTARQIKALFGET